MNSLKLLFNASAVVGLCALSGQGWAGCSIVSDSAATAVEVSVGTITVPSGTAVGTLLKTVIVPDTADTWISCSGPGYLRFQYGYGTGRSAITGPGIPTGVVSSGVEGIGVKVTSGDPWISYAKLPEAAGLSWIGASRQLPWSGMFGVKIEFFKTGDITPGELSFPRNFVEMWASTSKTDTSNWLGVLYSTINISGTPELKVPGCVTPSLTVPLGKHAKSGFSGVGSTSASTPFTFAINNCDAGLNAVKYTFKPASGITLEDSGLSTQHLTVKSGPGTASGIGVQVLYNNDTLVPFNTAISTMTSSHTIPMKARYIQTAPAISAGEANSALEFTMTYQ
ncbi:fimbrial protein [Phytobacter ursingii]